jgi:hypothetical protein
MASLDAIQAEDADQDSGTYHNHEKSGYHRMNDRDT